MLCAVCSVIPFGEDSSRLFVFCLFVFFVCMKRIFTKKILEQALICYVLNVVNNYRNLFIFSFSFNFYSLLYVPVDRRKKIGILSKRQNNTVSFTCQLGLGRI